jgi:hypothetical protein
MQDDAADQLDIEMAHAERSDRCLSSDGKRLRQKAFERFTVGMALFEFGGFRAEFSVREFFDASFQLIYTDHNLTHPFDLTLILRTEDFLEYGGDHNEILS